MLFPNFDKIGTRIVDQVVDHIDAGAGEEVDVGIPVAVMGADVSDERQFLAARGIAAQKRAFVMPTQSLGKDGIGYRYIVVLPLTADGFILRP